MFLFTYTVTMVIMVVAGGKGTLAGPVVGAVLFTALPEALREATSWQWQMLAYGVILMAVAAVPAAWHRARAGGGADAARGRAGVVRARRAVSVELSGVGRP